MKATLIGILVATFGVLVGGITHAVSPVYLLSNAPALLVVIVGATGATMASFGMATTSGIFKAMMRVMLPKPELSPAERLETIVNFASRARQEGLLSLESDVAKLEDTFMQKALQLAIDGSDPEDVADVMRTDIRTMKARHKVNADWCMTLGIFAPTFGIIGAVVGLIATLGELDKPEKLGAGIAGAFVATFLGVFIANGVMLPLSARMKRMSAQEVQAREMVVEGVLAIQGGQNPRVIEETLMSYLSPKEAEALRAASSSS